MTNKAVFAIFAAMLLPASPLAAQYYKGTMNYTGPRGAVVTQIVFNLAFNGNKIGGAIGIGSVAGGATIVGALNANIPVQGTRTGQSCTVAITGPQGGAVFTGVCTATSFSGTYRVGAQAGTFNVSTGGSVPPLVAPAAPRAPPPAQQQPGQSTYCGRFTGPGYGAQTEPVTIRLAGLNNAAGSITVGNGLAGSGSFIESLAGTACKGSTGYLTFEGTCNGATVAAYFVSNAGKGVGHFEASTQACTYPQAALPAPAPVPASVIAANEPAPGPAPTAAPMAPPAATSPTLYCGNFSNTTLHFGGMVQIRVNAGAGFTGQVSFGQALSGASVDVVGSGTFSGTRTGTSCQATDSTGLKFTGTCTATRIDASYSVIGQAGTFSATTQDCGK